MSDLNFSPVSYSARLKEIDSSLPLKNKMLNANLEIVNKECGFIRFLKVLILPIARMFSLDPFAHVRANAVALSLFREFKKHETSLSIEDRHRVFKVIKYLDSKTKHKYRLFSLVPLACDPQMAPRNSIAAQDEIKKSKEKAFSILMEKQQQLKENLSVISVQYKNLNQGGSKEKLNQSSLRQMEAASKAEKLMNGLKLRLEESKKEELIRVEQDLKAMVRVLKSITEGIAKMNLDLNQQRFLDIIRPYCTAANMEGKKISMKDLQELRGIAEKFEEEDIQKLFDAIVLNALESPNPPEITVYNLNGYLANAGIIIKKEKYLAKSPLSDALEMMDKRYRKSKRFLKEKLEAASKSYKDAREKMEKFCDVFSQVFGVENPKKKLNGAIVSADYEMMTASTPSEQKVIENQLKENLKSLLCHFHSAINQKLYDSEPAFKRLLDRYNKAEPGSNDKKEKLLALAKFRMSKPAKMEEFKQKLAEKIPEYATKAFSDTPQWHGLEKILSMIASDTFTGSIPDHRLKMQKAKAQLEALLKKEASMK